MNIDSDHKRSVGVSHRSPPPYTTSDKELFFKIKFNRKSWKTDTNIVFLFNQKKIETKSAFQYILGCRFRNQIAPIDRRNRYSKKI